MNSILKLFLAIIVLLVVQSCKKDEEISYQLKKPDKIEKQASAILDKNSPLVKHVKVLYASENVIFTWDLAHYRSIADLREDDTPTDERDYAESYYYYYGRVIDDSGLIHNNMTIRYYTQTYKVFVEEFKPLAKEYIAAAEFIIKNNITREQVEKIYEGLRNEIEEIRVNGGCTYDFVSNLSRYFPANAYDYEFESDVLRRVNQKLLQSIYSMDYSYDSLTGKFYATSWSKSTCGGQLSTWKSTLDNYILEAGEEANYVAAIEREVENLTNTYYDPITNDKIVFYLIAQYKGSILMNQSTHSIEGNEFAVGSFYVKPSYSKSGKLLFYTAGSHEYSGYIVYLIHPSYLGRFRQNIKYYEAGAKLFYMNGIPSYDQIQMAAGDRFEALLSMWGESLKSPEYWAYLINSFVVAAEHPRVRAAVEEAIPSGAPYTRSTLELGRRMHAEYKAGLADKINTFKEFRLPSGRRIDFIDIENGIVYELKPNNPRQIAAGNKQLDDYVAELMDPRTIARDSRLRGKVWKKVLDKY